MLVFYVHFRRILGWLFLAILTALIGEFAIEVAREHGLYTHPTETVVNLVSAVRNFPLFWPLLTGLGGLLAGMYVDTLVRARAKPLDSESNYEWHSKEDFLCMTDEKTFDRYNDYMRSASAYDRDIKYNTDHLARKTMFLTSQSQLAMEKAVSDATRWRHESAVKAQEKYELCIAILHEKLQNGDLIARGFRYPISENPKCQLIPKDYWRFLRFNSELTDAVGQDVKYSGIEIAESS